MFVFLFWKNKCQWQKDHLYLNRWSAEFGFLDKLTFCFLASTILYNPDPTSHLKKMCKCIPCNVKVYTFILDVTNNSSKFEPSK